MRYGDRVDLGAERILRVPDDLILIIVFVPGPCLEVFVSIGFSKIEVGGDLGDGEFAMGETSPDKFEFIV